MRIPDDNCHDGRAIVTNALLFGPRHQTATVEQFPLTTREDAQRNHLGLWVSSAQLRKLTLPFTTTHQCVYVVRPEPNLALSHKIPRGAWMLKAELGLRNPLNFLARKITQLFSGSDEERKWHRKSGSSENSSALPVQSK